MRVGEIALLIAIEVITITMSLNVKHMMRTLDAIAKTMQVEVTK